MYINICIYLQRCLLTNKKHKYLKHIQLSIVIANTSTDWDKLKFKQVKLVLPGDIETAWDEEVHINYFLYFRL